MFMFSAQIVPNEEGGQVAPAKKCKHMVEVLGGWWDFQDNTETVYHIQPNWLNNCNL